jgi:hypothetical protein
VAAGSAVRRVGRLARTGGTAERLSGRARAGAPLTGLAAGAPVAACPAVIRITRLVHAGGTAERLFGRARAGASLTGLAAGAPVAACPAVIRITRLVHAGGTAERLFGRARAGASLTGLAAGTRVATCAAVGVVAREIVARDGTRGRAAREPRVARPVAARSVAGDCRVYRPGARLAAWAARVDVVIHASRGRSAQVLAAGALALTADAVLTAAASRAAPAAVGVVGLLVDARRREPGGGAAAVARVAVDRAPASRAGRLTRAARRTGARLPAGPTVAGIVLLVDACRGCGTRTTREPAVARKGAIAGYACGLRVAHGAGARVAACAAVVCIGRRIDTYAAAQSWSRGGAAGRARVAAAGRRAHWVRAGAHGDARAAVRRRGLIGLAAVVGVAVAVRPTAGARGCRNRAGAGPGAGRGACDMREVRAIVAARAAVVGVARDAGSAALNVAGRAALRRVVAPRFSDGAAFADHAGFVDRATFGDHAAFPVSGPGPVRVVRVGRRPILRGSTLGAHHDDLVVAARICASRASIGFTGAVVRAIGARASRKRYDHHQEAPPTTEAHDRHPSDWPRLEAREQRRCDSRTAFCSPIGRSSRKLRGTMNRARGPSDALVRNGRFTADLGPPSWLRRPSCVLVPGRSGCANLNLEALLGLEQTRVALATGRAVAAARGSPRSGASGRRLRDCARLSRCRAGVRNSERVAADSAATSAAFATLTAGAPRA